MESTPEQSRAASTRGEIPSGPSLTIGSAPAPVDSATVQATVGAAIAAETAAKQSRGSMGSRTVAASAVVLAFAAILIVGGLFMVRSLEVAASSSKDWNPIQLAVPQLVGQIRTGSGFLIEDNGKLWLATNYHVIEGEKRVDVLFRDPSTGKTLVSSRAVPTAKFLVHSRFLEANDASEDGRTFDFALLDIEEERPKLERAGIRPLTLVDSKSVGAGEQVVALGHPGSDSLDPLLAEDSAVQEIATHSIFEGIVSSIRRHAGKPTLVQTTAPFASGCKGGPLVVESTKHVVGVNTWVERDSEGGEANEGLRFSLAADHVLDVLRGGTSLASIREQVVSTSKEPVPQTGNTAEAVAWTTFPKLDEVAKLCLADGWKVASQAIVVTSKSGLFTHVHEVRAKDGAQVAVLAVPRERMIDADIEEITAPGFRGLGESMGLASGGLEAVGVRLPDEEDFAIAEAGVKLNVPLTTYFLGEPVPARVVVLVLERELSGVDAEVGGHADAPPTGVAQWQRAVPSLTPTYPQEVSSWRGSGFVAEFAGKWWLVTNQHILRFAPGLRATFFDETLEHAEILTIPDVTISRFRLHSRFRLDAEAIDNFDLAVAELTEAERKLLESHNIRALPLADSPVSETTPICVIGHPKDLQYRNSITSGTVAQNRRSDKSGCIQVQVDAGTNPGNSGGPIIEMETGRVVAVLSWGLQENSQLLQGLRFGVSAVHVAEVAKAGAPVPPRNSDSLKSELWAKWSCFPSIVEAVDDAQARGKVAKTQRTVRVPQDAPVSVDMVRALLPGAGAELMVFSSTAAYIEACVLAPNGEQLWKQVSQSPRLPRPEQASDEVFVLRCLDKDGNSVASDCLILTIE